jgi:hypothetical protein
MKESFQRKRIYSDDHMRKVICYIHNNPVNHNFVEQPEQWNYSSYNSLINDADPLVLKAEVVELFDSVANLKSVHRQFRDVELE